jgi:uncharacterized protein YndB with AHSA1/START domain
MDARVGGSYRVRFRTVDGVEHEAFGDIVEVAPPHRLTMTWSFSAGGEPEEDGRVSRIVFEVRAIEGGSELTFTHSQLRNEASGSSHRRGWSGAFDKLVAQLALMPNQEE